MKAREQRARRADPLEKPSAAPAFEGPPPSIDELIAEGDAETLIELAAAYRAGTTDVERDLTKALECYVAASRLGSDEAEYLAGVAYMDGIGVPVDLAEGAKRLRAAAQRGSLRAKVYVANLYELGVYYQADREKADVWYRNVARAAKIEAEPGSDEHALAMAELGCVRDCLKLVADEALSAKDRAFYLKKAKVMGYHHRLAAAKQDSAPAIEPAPDPAPDPIVEPPPEREAEPAQEREERAKAEPEIERENAPLLLGAQWTWGAGVLAFAAAAFFVSVATGAGWLAMEGSRALSQLGRALPYVNGAHEAVFGSIVLALGVVPATATYRPKVVAIAAALGVAVGAAGHFAWDAKHLLWDRLSQTAAGGLGTFLLVLFVLGVLGGTRSRASEKRRSRA